MRIVCLVLAASFQLVYSSSILVDWSATTSAESIAYVLDYSPAVGNPPAGTSLGSSALRALITDTIPACEYTVYLSAIMPNGQRKHITKKIIYSSPDPPILDSIETTEDEATVSYFPPKEANISFHIEYYPEEHPDYANQINTKASLVRLRGLDSGTAFRIKIWSVYNDVKSTESIESIFRTAGTPEYDYQSSPEAFSIRTLPPGFDLATATPPTTVPATSDYEYSSEEVDKELRSSTTTPTLHVSSSVGEYQTPSQKPSTSRASSSSSLATTTTSSRPDSSRATTITSLPSSTTRTAATTRTTVLPLVPSSETTASSVAAGKIPTTKTMSKPAPVARPEVEEVDGGDDESHVRNHGNLAEDKMVAEFGEPSWISMSDDESMIRLNWTVPDGSLCDAFLVNYTVVTLTRPKSYSVATSDDFTLIKFFANHTLDIRVFCMLAGSLSKTWWAHRIVHLSNPVAVQKARVISSETDEFYVSRITLDWNWPAHNDFDLYRIVVSYGIGQANANEIEVTEVGPVVLDKLEPTQRYRIAIRNESMELGLSSKVVEIEQLTGPIISSTVFPGRISSTAININFGDSDVEQGRFDHYELVFTGNNKNITKRIDIKQEKSLTFTKLIPGKTYFFTLYTVYKGQRSRPVIEPVTTYPLKVNALFPVVGREYVVLYWDVENFADSDCRFRLSYNADRVETVSVDLKGASRHRFNGLMPDVYYTFTITVIMGIGQAAAESESEMITVYVPRIRAPTASLRRQGSRELIVKFEYDQQTFSPLNGAIDNVAVIVSDETDLNDDNYELRSWFEVNSEETWGSYRASPLVWNPFKKNSREATFTIGSDDCIRRSLDEPYCNGILRANVPYKVKLRAYLDTKVAMESDWIAVDGSEDDEEEEEKGERRLPCHMYLNGCPRKSSTARGLSTVAAMLLLMWLL